METKNRSKVYKVNLGVETFERWSMERKKLGYTNEKFGSFLFSKWEELEYLKMEIKKKGSKTYSVTKDVETQYEVIPEFQITTPTKCVKNSTFNFETPTSRFNKRLKSSTNLRRNDANQNRVSCLFFESDSETSPISEIRKNTPERNESTMSNNSFISPTGGVTSNFGSPLLTDDCAHLTDQFPRNPNICPKDAVNAEMVLVFLDKIEQLVKQAFGLKCYCGLPLRYTSVFRGSALIFYYNCPAVASGPNHKNGVWESQDNFRGIYSGNIKLASAVLLAGNEFAKIEKWARFAKIHLISDDTFYRYQRHFIQPAILQYWQNMQNELFIKLAGKELLIAGDGRNDSPGFSATYCTYTFADCETNKILAISTVDVREADGKSPNMEFIGFQRAAKEIMELAKDNSIVISEVVTDAHCKIKVEMKKPDRIFKNATHSLDTWHAGKNIRAKIADAGKLKATEELVKWAPDIRNHFWFCARNCEGDVDKLQASFQSVLNHVTDYHEWLTDFGAGYSCAHEIPLPNAEERDKKWLEVNSKAYKALEDIVLNKNFQKNLEYYVNFRHTGFVEVFHNLMLAYVSKRNFYSWDSYKARVTLAAIDHNQHADRKQARTKDGQLRYRYFYSKKSKSYNVGKVFEPKQYNYIDSLIESIFVEKENYVGNVSDPSFMGENDPRHISSNISMMEKPPNEELLAKHMSRF